MLTARQQAELRALSSRATITAASFVNEYHWGNLKGEPLDWMERFFDAHVYSANWNSCRLLLRLPRGLFEAKVLNDYVVRPESASHFALITAFEATDTDKYCVLDWSFNDDSGEHARFSEQDGPGWMAQLLPLRDELLRGDARSLYLGWLARLCNGELQDDDREPPLPSGLQTLTPAQESLAEFLLLDPDWLAAAAEISPPLPVESDHRAHLDLWLLGLPEEEMRHALRLLLEGQGLEVKRNLRSRFLKWEHARSPQHATGTKRRMVADIDARRGAVRALRLQREQEAHDAAEFRRKAERVRHLTALLDNEDTIWSNIDKHLQRGSGSAYGQAFQALQELAEAHARSKSDAVFRRNLVRLMAKHGKRAAWVARLTKAGFLWEPKT